MNNKEEILCKHVEYNDIENVRRLLDQGNKSSECTLTSRVKIKTH